MTTTLTSPIDLGKSTYREACARVSGVTLILTLTFFIVWLASLSRNIFDPIGYDQAVYQYFAERVLAGQRMYVDLWDQSGPGIVGIHCLSTLLVGRSPMALRVFDACWQSLTLLALILLGGRDGRKWSTGFLAATLYALAYYATGYVHTAQREGFTALLLLIMVHATACDDSRKRSTWSILLYNALAGVMGLAVFAIKSPLGACFGVLWLWTLIEAWQHRHRGSSAWAGLVGLTIGFILSATAGVILLMKSGWWSGFWPVLLRMDIPGYTPSPTLIRDIMPYVLPGTILAATTTWFVLRRRNDHPSKQRSLFYREWIKTFATCLFIFGMILSIQYFHDFRHILSIMGGLLLPAIGSAVIRPWQGRSRIWRATMLLACATLAAIFIQGWFYLYQFAPLFALAAYLSADEIIERLGRFKGASHPSGIWGIVCLAAVIHLAVSPWGNTMTLCNSSPYVLAGGTLEDHYTRITRHKQRFPTYATTARVAQRVRELTTDTDPIACLIDEPRIYYQSQRPMVYKLPRTQDVYAFFFPEYIRAILETRPKVILTCVPEGYRNTKDLEAIASAIFDDAESYFGPSAQALRECYTATEVIDEVCIMQPIKVKE